MNRFYSFFKKLWWWNILIDFVLISICLIMIGTFWMKLSSNAKEGNTYFLEIYNSFLVVMAIVALHSFILFILAVYKFWQKRIAEGIALFFHAVFLIPIGYFLYFLLLLPGIGSVGEH